MKIEEDGYMKRVKKGKCEISQKQKFDKKEKKQKVTTKTITLKATQKRNTQHWSQKKKEIIEQIENEEQDWEENEEDQKDVELTDKREKEYIIRAVHIETQVKDNLRQNGKKEDSEKRSRDKR